MLNSYSPNLHWSNAWAITPDNGTTRYFEGGYWILCAVDEMDDHTHTNEFGLVSP
jgi:hypothetical protein